jgi:hypothetical protein
MRLIEFLFVAPVSILSAGIFFKSHFWSSRLAILFGGSIAIISSVLTVHEIWQFFSPSALPVATIESNSKAEDEAWSQAIGLGSRAAYEDYLGRFPAGAYADEARIKISSLDAAAQNAAAAENRKLEESFLD